MGYSPFCALSSHFWERLLWYNLLWTGVKETILQDLLRRKPTPNSHFLCRKDMPKLVKAMRKSVCWTLSLIRYLYHPLQVQRRSQKRGQKECNGGRDRMLWNTVFQKWHGCCIYKVIATHCIDFDSSLAHQCLIMDRGGTQEALSYPEDLGAGEYSLVGREAA